MNKKTVLIVTSHYPPNIGGVESHLQALVNGLNERGWQAIVSTYQPLAYSKQAPRIEKHPGLIIHRQSWLGFNIVHKLTHYPVLEFLYLFPGLLIGTILTMWQYRFQIDVVHCQGLVPTAVGVVTARLFSKRIVASTHNLYFFPKTGLYSWSAKLILNSTDRILVPTEIAKAELVRIGIKARKIGFFKYWINLSKFTPTKSKQAVFKGSGFKVLFVGRLITTKGVPIILEMVKNVRKGIKFYIAGSGSMENEVQQVEKEYPSNLVFLGRIENEQLPIYYTAADLVIVPSTVDEGWGFVVMEAVSCGSPVVASNKGGLSDVVNPAIGQLAEPNFKGFTQAIERLSTNSSQRQKLKKNCRAYALKYFSEANVDTIVQAYE